MSLFNKKTDDAHSSILGGSPAVGSPDYYAQMRRIQQEHMTAVQNYPIYSAHGVGGIGIAPGSSLRHPRDFSREERLELRLNMSLRELHDKGLDLVGTRSVGDQVFVFAMHEGKPLTLADETALFPSDVLVSKINVLLG